MFACRGVSKSHRKAIPLTQANKSLARTLRGCCALEAESRVERELKPPTSVLWIGGANDAGKTTVARILAERYRLQAYSYDRHDLRHHERLAQNSPDYHRFLSASIDERWVHPTPEVLLQRSLQSFRDRFALMVEDLLALPEEPAIVAEGFGLTPELLAPALADVQRAVWLVPTEAFKRASLQRRDKWAAIQQLVTDPQKATGNLFARDMLMAWHIEAQARTHGLTVYEVDGSRSAEEVADLVAQHFGPFLHS